MSAYSVGRGCNGWDVDTYAKVCMHAWEGGGTYAKVCMYARMKGLNASLPPATP